MTMKPSHYIHLHFSCEILMNFFTLQVSKKISMRSKNYMLGQTRHPKFFHDATTWFKALFLVRWFALGLWQKLDLEYSWTIRSQLRYLELSWTFRAQNTSNSSMLTVSLQDTAISNTGLNRGSKMMASNSTEDVWTKTQMAKILYCKGNRKWRKLDDRPRSQI